MAGFAGVAGESGPGHGQVEQAAGGRLEPTHGCGAGRQQGRHGRPGRWGPRPGSEVVIGAASPALGLIWLIGWQAVGIWWRGAKTRVGRCGSRAGSGRGRGRAATIGVAGLSMCETGVVGSGPVMTRSSRSGPRPVATGASPLTGASLAAGPVAAERWSGRLWPARVTATAPPAWEGGGVRGAGARGGAGRRCPPAPPLRPPRGGRGGGRGRA